MRYRKTLIKEDYLIEFKIKRGDKTKIANMIGVDRSYVSQVLNNKEIASESTYLKIKKAIKIINDDANSTK